MKTFFILLVCLGLIIAVKANDNGKNSTETKSYLNILGSTNVSENDLCSSCYEAFFTLHREFQDPVKRSIFAEVAKEECLDEECRKKIDALVESITINTEPEEGCKVVCDK